MTARPHHRLVPTQGAPPRSCTAACSKSKMMIRKDAMARRNMSMSLAHHGCCSVEYRCTLLDTVMMPHGGW